MSTRPGARESRIRVRKLAMLAGHSVNLTKHGASTERVEGAECRGTRGGGGFPRVASLHAQERIVSFGGRERERERVAVPSKFHRGRGSSTRCEHDDKRGGLLALFFSLLRDSSLDKPCTGT